MAIVQHVDGVPFGSGGVVVDDFTPPSNGQTVFNLSQVPSNTDALLFLVNDVSYLQLSGAFSVVGTVLTWANPFVIESSDTVFAHYSV